MPFSWCSVIHSFDAWQTGHAASCLAVGQAGVVAWWWPAARGWAALYEAELAASRCCTPRPSHPPGSCTAAPHCALGTSIMLPHHALALMSLMPTLQKTIAGNIHHMRLLGHPACHLHTSASCRSWTRKGQIMSSSTVMQYMSMRRPSLQILSRHSDISISQSWQ